MLNKVICKTLLAPFFLFLFNSGKPLTCPNDRQEIQVSALEVYSSFIHKLQNIIN